MAVWAAVGVRPVVIAMMMAWAYIMRAMVIMRTINRSYHYNRRRWRRHPYMMRPVMMSVSPVVALFVGVRILHKSD